MAYLHDCYGDTLGSSESDTPHLHLNDPTVGLQLTVSGSGGKASAAADLYPESSPVCSSSSEEVIIDLNDHDGIDRDCDPDQVSF